MTRQRARLPGSLPDGLFKVEASVTAATDTEETTFYTHCTLILSLVFLSSDHQEPKSLIYLFQGSNVSMILLLLCVNLEKLKETLRIGR
ncbi:hypothetical protein [Phaffia rhodozyma]|uniref:Uncharacterized protein n=1 Tax=Phaffia rhodozyma TaxID=264483 RepID=A0A0F7SFL5_PHARH|nr:hypothetical protein [Phaffia rhodozyma]